MKQSILVSILLLCGYSTFGQTVPANDNTSLTKGIEVYLREQGEKGFSGSVIVAKKNKVLVNQSYGPVTVHGSKPAYWIASNSKSFTAAAIMRLQEQGKLSVSDPITKFIQNVPAEKQAITIHDLLTHTSGLAHRYAADGIVDRGHAAQALLTAPLKWKVGTEFHYSNDGYNLLALIVEIASGRKFEDYLRSQVLKPARLKHTGFWGMEGSAIITSSKFSAAGIGPTIYKDGRSVANWGYRGATGIYTTADDLYRWMIALRDLKVLTRKSTEQLWGKQAPMNSSGAGEEKYYSYGWSVVFRSGNRDRVEHTGVEDWLGHNAVMTLFDDGDAIVVLSNSGQVDNRSWSSIVAREIQTRLRR